MTRVSFARAAVASLLPLLAGCAVAAAPPSPDPIAGGLRSEGRIDGEASAAQTAFCVSRQVPLSYVALPSDGAAVRPVAGTLPAGRPDWALTLRQTERGATWLRQVDGTDTPAAFDTADRLDRALAGCAPVRGNGA